VLLLDGADLGSSAAFGVAMPIERARFIPIIFHYQFSIPLRGRKRSIPVQNLSRHIAQSAFTRAGFEKNAKKRFQTQQPT
jgi:hypothetical protein